VLAEADDDCNSSETLVSSVMYTFLKNKPTIVFELMDDKA